MALRDAGWPMVKPGDRFILVNASQSLLPPDWNGTAFIVMEKRAHQPNAWWCRREGDARDPLWWVSEDCMIEQSGPW
jgi:hypothetical protein